MIRYVLIIFVLAVPAVAPLAADQGGTQSPFSLGAGARDISLGGAALAECHAATAAFWNASRLARAEQYSLTGFHTNLFESDVTYQYFGLAVPTVDFGSFGLGIFRLGIQGIEKRDAGDLYLGDIEDNRLAVYVAYARSAAQYDVGLSIMFEHHSLDGNTATSSPGINLSGGRRFDLNWERLKHVMATLNLRNLIRPKMELVEEGVNYPLAADLGLTVGIIPNPRWNQSASLSLGLTKVDHLNLAFKAGIEYNIENLLMIRAGLRGGKFSIGAGIIYRIMSFDYALVGRDLGALHMLTLTSSFGTPVSERRQARISRREAEFDRMMQNRLVNLNREKVAELIATGREYLDAGNLAEAANSFDKALFMARSSALDTTDISDLAAEAGKRLDEVLRTQRYRQYVDSARVKLESQDYLGARYFAGMAISERPDSDEAALIMEQADEAIRLMESQEEMITKRLWVADSLLSYGQIDQALAALNALSEYAPGNISVMKARRKAAFERWRAIASSAYSSEKFERALSALDSALALYPGHEWCRDMKERIRKEIRLQAQKPVAEIPAPPEPLSPELQKEVAVAYSLGQEMFTKGELPEAIKYWEKVERLAPGYSSVRSYLVNAYKFVGIDLYSRNRFDDAVQVWKKAAQLDPHNEEINGYIKRTETEIRKLQELSYDQ